MKLTNKAFISKVVLTKIIIAIVCLSQSAFAKEYIVKYKNENALNKMISARAKSDGLSVMSTHKPGQLALVDISQKNEARVLASIYTDSNVEYVVPNTTVKAFTAPIQTQALREQYALAKVQAEKAWQRAGNRGSKNVIVAVIDTGVDFRHKNLAPNMIPGYDFHANDDDPTDETQILVNPGHGTHCAGVVGATGLVDGGIQGLSPEVSILPIRFLGKDGSGDFMNAVRAIDYAISKNAQVISASWGAAMSAADAQPVLEAISRAEAAGVIFVAAAANDSKNNDANSYYPTNADNPNVISVAASDAADAKPAFSNFGRAKVDIAAPGDAIISTIPRDRYQNLSGTSMAAPLVAGLVAFLKAQDSSLTASEIKALIQTTGTQVPIETACNCRIDAFTAVDTLLSRKTWMVPAAGTYEIGSIQQFNVKNGTGFEKFEVTDPGVASITEQGLLTAKSVGKVKVLAKNSNGFTTASMDIYVGTAPTEAPPGEQCPLGNPVNCQLACLISPNLPFCK